MCLTVLELEKMANSTKALFDLDLDLNVFGPFDLSLSFKRFDSTVGFKINFYTNCISIEDLSLADPKLRTDLVELSQFLNYTTHEGQESPGLLSCLSSSIQNSVKYAGRVAVPIKSWNILADELNAFIDLNMTYHGLKSYVEQISTQSKFMSESSSVACAVDQRRILWSGSIEKGWDIKVKGI